MTLIDLITDAYRMSGIVPEYATPDATQGAKGVTRLNDMMAALAGDGIDLGYAPRASTADTFSPPLEHVLGIKSMLAVSLCGDYGVEVPVLVAQQAQNGMDRMLRQAAVMQNVPLSLRTVSHGAGGCGDYNILTDG